MGKSILCRTQWRRFFIYLSGTYLAVFSAIVFPAIGILRAAQGQSNSPEHPHVLRWLIVGLIVGFALIVLRNYLEYRRVIYDPHWALSFQDRFDNIAEQRSKASKVLLYNKAELGNVEKPGLTEIDDVLDFFEDVGLYQRADHVSPELAHHHFFHWTRGYWQAARTYVEAWRRKEPARWNHVEELFETICDIELKEHGGKREQLLLSDSDLDKFLKDECGDEGD